MCLEALEMHRRENPGRRPANKDNDTSHLHFRGLSPVIKSDTIESKHVTFAHCHYLLPPQLLLHAFGKIQAQPFCFKTRKHGWQHFYIICSLQPTVFD